MLSSGLNEAVLTARKNNSKCLLQTLPPNKVRSHPSLFSITGAKTLLQDISLPKFYSTNTGGNAMIKKSTNHVSALTVSHRMLSVFSSNTSETNHKLSRNLYVYHYLEKELCLVVVVLIYVLLLLAFITKSKRSNKETAIASGTACKERSSAFPRAPGYSHSRAICV